MVAISDSDDDDISSNINSLQKRKVISKLSKNKIEDSDSSCDETNEVVSKNLSVSEENNSSKTNDIVESSNKVLDENVDNDENCNSCKKDKPDEGINTDLNDENCNIPDKNSETNNTTDSENSDSLSKKVRKKKGIGKNTSHRFDDSSSDEEDIKKTRIHKKHEDKKLQRSKLKDKLHLDSGPEIRNEETDDDTGVQSDVQNDENERPNQSTLDGDTSITDMLKNKDLFDADESDEEDKSKYSTNNSNEKDDVNKMGNSCSEDESEKTTEEGPRKEKRPNKDAIKESKSEQQRLLRQQKFKLPYHVPEVKPLKDFLLRVPVLKGKGRKEASSSEQPALSDEIVLVENGDVLMVENEEDLNAGPSESIFNQAAEKKVINKKIEQPRIDNLFKQRPTLSFCNDEESIEFEETIECEKIDSNHSSKKKGELDSFMARFEKHTKGSKRKDIPDKNSVDNDCSIVRVVIPEKERTPGERRIAFAKQMKQKIRKERAQTLKEREKERKLYNEEDSSEEEEEEYDDEGYDEDEEENEEAGTEAVNELDAESSGDDVEREKWNYDEQRKELENQMTEDEEKAKKTNENDNETVDFSVEGRKTQEKDDMHWDDTSSTVSSFLPPGQGDPTGRKNSYDGRMTPFSKLIKSGLLDSTSNLNDHNSCSEGPVGGGLTLPCEDTQDLYIQNQKNEEESQMMLDGFSLNLNEETQYTQVIDSQGFFDSKKSKRQLFEDVGKDGINDFSQVIGLCSGKFEDEASESAPKSEGGGGGHLFDNVDKAGISDFSQVIGLCSGKFDDDDDSQIASKSQRKSGELFEKDNEFSMTQVIGLCSGKFSDNNPVSSTNIQSTREECNGNDEGSNPPIVHPFSSRVVNDSSQFSDSIFSLGGEKSVEKVNNSEKPLGLTGIMDNNFDDNAIDYCTAPFSEKVGDVENEDEKGKRAKENDNLNSQTKFNVANWLNNEDVKDNTGKKIKKKRDKVHTDSHEEDVFSDHRDDDDDDDDDDEGGGGGGSGGTSDDDAHGDEDDEEEDEGAEKSDGENVWEDEDDDNENEVAEELLEYQDAITGGGKKKKKKWSKSAFTEKEAELSGSDINSDEEELGSEYDEYEVDSDIEDLPSGEKLKAQVHKIHQKKLLDQDEREVKLLQELYIDDDLGEGKKRQRNFRWRNMADDDGGFNATRQSDDEEDELNLDADISQKLERAEREKYISEIEKQEEENLDENSQSMLGMIKDPMSFIAGKGDPSIKAKLPYKGDGRSISQKRSGSFMSQTKSAFSHLASVAKTVGQGGKAFVFQASEDAKKDNKEGDKNKENKAVNRKESMSEPAMKKVKFNKQDGNSNSNSQSIFDLL